MTACDVLGDADSMIRRKSVVYVGGEDGFFHVAASLLVTIVVLSLNVGELRHHDMASGGSESLHSFQFFPARIAIHDVCCHGALNC